MKPNEEQLSKYQPRVIYRKGESEAGLVQREAEQSRARASRRTYAANFDLPDTERDKSQAAARRDTPVSELSDFPVSGAGLAVGKAQRAASQAAIAAKRSV